MLVHALIALFIPASAPSWSLKKKARPLSLYCNQMKLLTDVLVCVSRVVKGCVTHSGRRMCGGVCVPHDIKFHSCQSPTLLPDRIQSSTSSCLRLCNIIRRRCSSPSSLLGKTIQDARCLMTGTDVVSCKVHSQRRIPMYVKSSTETRLSIRDTC